ncbi:MAG: thiaminase II [Geminicoccaceae bacterium]
MILFLTPPESVAGHLIAEADEAWHAYTNHSFVRQLGAGSLSERAFRSYLIQDYLFLIHFARAYGLAAFKADTIEDIRQATVTQAALINDEIRLHVDYCYKFGIGETEMAATPEHPANIAYTRFVMERGLAGDLLDLLVALAPCVIGYGEIGRRLADASASDDNPYRSWIEMYSGADYGEVVGRAIDQLDRVAVSRLGADPLSSPRWAELTKTFEQACRLEAGFWQMGLDLGAGD